MSMKWRPYKVFFDYPEYIEARDKLIPAAEDYANRTAGLRPTPKGGAQSYAGREEIQAWGNTWDLVFHREMNRLAVEAGLCSPR